MNNKEKQLKNNNAVGKNALGFIDSMLTTDEVFESDIRVALIGETINAKNSEAKSNSD